MLCIVIVLNGDAVDAVDAVRAVDVGADIIVDGEQLKQRQQHQQHQQHPH